MAMFTTATTATTAATAPASNQDKIKYLKRYITLDREIEHKLREIDHWRAKLTRITPVYTTEPKGGGSIYGNTETIVTRIIDLETEINADIDRLIDIRNDIKTIIDTVEDDRERIILQYRYLEGKTFEWIAAELELSWQWVHTLHSRSLSKINIES